MRTLEIHPPSVRAETVNVLKAAVAIVMVVAAYIFRPSLGTDNTTRQLDAGLLPYQRLIRDAAPAEQRIFRELQEGLLEAERIRAETGHWPDVTTLEGEGIPPFAPDPTRKIEYKWTSVRQDWATNYLGVPSESSVPGLGARHPRARARRAGGSGAERRNAPPAARRHDAARVDLEYAGSKAPQRIRRAAAAAERRVDELVGRRKWSIET